MKIYSYNDEDLTVEEEIAARDRELDDECEAWFDSLPTVSECPVADENYRIEMYRATADVCDSAQMRIFF